jgi:hypothetical protein
MVSDEDREHYRGLAANLATAWVASQMGLSSLDYAAKHYVEGQVIGELWFVLAKIVSRAATEGVETGFATKLLALLNEQDDDTTLH